MSRFLAVFSRSVTITPSSLQYKTLVSSLRVVNLQHFQDMNEFTRSSSYLVEDARSDVAIKDAIVNVLQSLHADLRSDSASAQLLFNVISRRSFYEGQASLFP